jgi:hypothetical protein
MLELIVLHDCVLICQENLKPQKLEESYRKTQKKNKEKKKKNKKNKKNSMIF